MDQAKPVPAVLVITWNFPPRHGGIENLVAGLSHNLKKSHPLFVVTSFASSAGRAEEGIFHSPWPGLLPFFLYAAWRGFILMWRRPGIKVVLGGSALVTPLVVLLAAIFRRSAVVLVHGLDLLYPNFLYQSFCVRWIKHCDRIIANSRYTASLARAKKGRADRVYVIPPAVDPGAFQPPRSEEAKKAAGLEGRKVLLYVGRLARRKGVKEFLEGSLTALVAEIPEVCFLIVGGNPTGSLAHRDDVLGEIGVVVRERGLENHVRLLGWLSGTELARTYQASDLLVLPALSVRDDVEGFGIVILEAAAAGVPCVAMRVGGIPDAVANGKSGVLLEPDDYASMTATLVNLLRDNEARQALGDYARRRVAAEFAWPAVIQKYAEILRTLES